MIKNTGLIGALLLAAVAILPLNAQAVCAFQGTIVRVLANDYNINRNLFVYVRAYAFDEHYFYGIVRDTNNEVALVNAITAAGTTRNRVWIRGDAASCPSTGESRWLGNIDFVMIAG